MPATPLVAPGVGRTAVGVTVADNELELLPAMTVKLAVGDRYQKLTV